MNMKLLHIVGDSEFGGGSVIVLQLARMAKQLGWQVDVLTTNREFADILRAGDIGVVEHDIPFLDPRGFFRLYRLLRSAGYDIVHTHSSQAAWVGGLAARLAGTPAILHTAHGFALDEGSHPLLLWFYTLHERLAARWSDRIVMMSDFHRRWALRLGIGDQRKITSIPNGISKRRFWAEPERLEARSRLGVSPGHLVFLVTVRLAAGSGVEYLIDATPALATRLYRPFSILVAGDGPFRASLERRARDKGVAGRFSFLGFREDIDELLAASDIVVFPSLRAGPSIELLEAMASAKPIVATSNGSNREVTRGDKAALLVPPANSAALAEAICMVSANTGRADRMARRARKLFLASYTVGPMLARYRDEYFRLLDATADSGRKRAEPQDVARKVARALVRAASRLVSPPVCDNCALDDLAFATEHDRAPAAPLHAGEPDGALQSLAIARVRRLIERVGRAVVAVSKGCGDPGRWRLAHAFLRQRAVRLWRRSNRVRPAVVREGG